MVGGAFVLRNFDQLLSACTPESWSKKSLSADIFCFQTSLHRRKEKKHSEKNFFVAVIVSLKV